MHTCHQRIYFFLMLILIGLGIGRITSTYPIFSETFDESAHIATGMEWLDKGTYTYETLHPPLARIAAALGLYLSDIHPDPNDYEEKNMPKMGRSLLFSGNDYMHRLTLARMGILPFFILGCFAVWVWGKHHYGAAPALLAVLLFSTLPPILAHSGLATTDMAITATLPLALFFFTLWFKTPKSLPLGALLGFTAALCFLTKFSSVIFLPLTAAGIILLHDIQTKQPSKGFSKPVLRGILLALISSILVIWAGYRFSVGSFFLFPEFFNGLASLILRNEVDREIYLFGVHTDNIWYYFLVVLYYKTPLSFLVASSIGIFFLIKDKMRWEFAIPIVSAVVILLIAMTFSKINIGVRHILPIYPFLALIAGYGLYRLWQVKFGKGITATIIIWHLIATTLAHPNYLSYFNELSGDDPSHILIDSDLDWGQDALRLVDTIRERKIENIDIYYFGNVDFGYFNLEAKPCAPFLAPVIKEDTKGWVAVSLSCLRPFEEKQLAWLAKHKPVAKVGTSILLYNLP